MSFLDVHHEFSNYCCQRRHAAVWSQYAVGRCTPAFASGQGTVAYQENLGQVALSVFPTDSHPFLRIVSSSQCFRPLPGRGKIVCENTAQDRWDLADDHGFLCTWDQLDWQTGCCTKGEQFACDRCNDESHCCETLESCVSCCLAPDHNASTIYSQDYRSPGRSETGHWGNTFDYCRGKCRTWSVSTVHENAYLDSHHHCFSQSGKPVMPLAPAPPIPATVRIEVGEKGESCTATCERTNGVCALEHMVAVNHCNVLRTHFACEAGCDNTGGDIQPSYVGADAPKEQQPTDCLVSDSNVQFNCDVSHLNTQRLCPCAHNSTA